MFTVQGYIDGVTYVVQVGGETPIGMRDRGGLTSGSVSAIALLDEYDGSEDVLVTPVGPSVTADPTTPEGVLAILHARTQVTDVEGEDVPDLIPADAGVVH